MTLIRGSDTFYEIGNTISKRSTSIGVEPRFKRVKVKDIGPEPGTYNLKSSFEQTPKGRATSFGYSRD